MFKLNNYSNIKLIYENDRSKIYTANSDIDKKKVIIKTCQ